MAAEDARTKAGLKTAEDELNLIKNQVQQTLLDIREHILDTSNPFNSIDNALTDEDEIEFGDDAMDGGGTDAAGADGDDGEGSADGESDGDSDENLEDVEGGGEEAGEELPGVADDGAGDDIIEEIPDDDSIGDEIIDDGGSDDTGVSEPGEYFEEEEVPQEVDEGFDVDEEPSTDDSAEADGSDGSEQSELEGDTSAEAETSPGGVVMPLTANFDVLTMAGLVRWVAVTTDRIGANRTEIMLDAFEAAGRIASSTRVVLDHLMALIEEDPGDKVPVREIVSAMVRMEGVMEPGATSDSARLMSLLMDVGEGPLDRLIA